MNAPANIEWSEQFRMVGKAWCDAEAAASMLEETKSAYLSQRMQEFADLPVSRAQMNVKASPEWGEFIEKMVVARKVANLLKIKLEYIRMEHADEQSANATRRAEM